MWTIRWQFARTSGFAAIASSNFTRAFFGPS